MPLAHTELLTHNILLRLIATPNGIHDNHRHGDEPLQTLHTTFTSNFPRLSFFSPQEPYIAPENLYCVQEEKLKYHHRMGFLLFVE